MELINKEILLKLKVKNRGNKLLIAAIDDLIKMIEAKQWTSKEEIKSDRPDADQIHPDGFYFFDIHIHRTIVIVRIGEDAQATVVWAVSHQRYERIFRNNKLMINKWLSDNEWI